MNVNWVAASIRARSLSQRRLGAGRCRQLATVANLPAALALLADSGYAQRLVGVTSLTAAQRATCETLLWQLRVLAGWLPPGGTGLVRAIAGIYERDNIVALAGRLAGGPELSEAYQLGGLATAWPRLHKQQSLPALTEALTKSAWGVSGPIDAIALRDVLTLAWLRRLSAAAPAASGWACSATALVAARMLLVDQTPRRRGCSISSVRGSVANGPAPVTWTDFALVCPALPGPSLTASMIRRTSGGPKPG